MTSIPDAAWPNTESDTKVQPPHRDATGTATRDPQQWGWIESSPGKITAGLFFGFIFGYLLQKGGVAKFDILVGVLLLENFVVVQVMLTAIIVGMAGSYLLRQAGVIELQIDDTRYAANIIGGLIFGVGFALLAYCPGTNAAALGQGNLDALPGMLGLLFGSYIFALGSKFGSGPIGRWGNRGKLTLPELVGVSQGKFIIIAVPVLTAILITIELAGY